MKRFVQSSTLKQHLKTFKETPDKSSEAIMPAKIPVKLEVVFMDEIQGRSNQLQSQTEEDKFELYKSQVKEELSEF